jgi:hypothetical protein
VSADTLEIIEREPGSEPSASPGDRSRRRFYAACALGALAAAIPFLLRLLGGRTSLLQHTWRGDFFDVQARSLLHLRWEVPRRVVDGEGFRIGGKEYIYFGPWPALLRLPLAALTRRFDGRLSELSMALAWVVAMLGVARLAWNTRVLGRGRDEPTRRECVVVGLFVFVVGVGSPILFLGSRPIVYNEAVLWGLAWTLVALASVITFIRTLRPWSLAAASVFATLAMLSRASMGIAPVLALAMVLVAVPVSALRRAASVPDAVAQRGRPWQLLGGLALPIVSYAYVNWAKFGTLVSIPFERQLSTLGDARLRAIVRANGGTMFELRALPTTVVHYFRPDGLRVQFPLPVLPEPGHAYGGAKFVAIQGTTSIPTSMPALTLLAIIGVVVLLRTDNRFTMLRIPVAAALVSTLITLTYAYITNRYLADFLPALILLALIGTNRLLAAPAPSDGKPDRRNVTWCAIAVLVLVGLWVNAGITRQQEAYRHSHDDRLLRSGAVADR